MALPLPERLEQDSIRQLWIVYHDYSGLSHAKSVPPERFADAIDHGIGFATANLPRSASEALGIPDDLEQEEEG